MVTRAVCVFACAALAACGGGDGADDATGGGSSEAGAEQGGDSKTFEGNGYSFSYPAEWTGGEEMSEDPRASATVVIPVREGTDGVYVRVLPGPESITTDNIGQFKDEIVRSVLSGLQQDEGRLSAEPTRLTLDGLPGLSFEGSVTTQAGTRERFRSILAFDGRTSYSVHCQFAAAGAEEVNQGCDQVLESFQVE